MNNAVEILIADAEAVLERAIRKISKSDLSGLAFVSWLLGSNPVECSQNEILDATKTCVDRADRTYRDIAALGFLHANGIEDQESMAAFESGLEWLHGCSAFIDDVPVGFATDAVALLGISLGTIQISKEDKVNETLSWLKSFSSRVCALPGVDEYQRSLIAAAHIVLGDQTAVIPSSTSCADIRIAMQSKSIFPESTVSTDTWDAMDMLLNGVIPENDPHRAAITFAAIKWLRRSSPRILPGQATLEQVASVLHSLPFALKRWTWEEKPKTRNGTARKWDVDHEYHFQNMLWLVLAPIFPDLTFEEFTPIIASYQPRSDIAIPCLKLIVEAKFWRQGTSINQMVEEISADSGLYFVDGSRYAHLLPVIWDDARRSEDHHILRTGLKKLPRVVDAVIVGRPGSFTADQND